MTDLGHAETNAILDFVGTARSFPDLPAFREGILPGLRELVPCDVVGYNEVDTATGHSLVLLDRPEAMLDDTERRLTKLAHQHPLIRLQSTARYETATISDFLSEREFHRLELYDDIYREMGAEDQMAFGLPGNVVVGIAFNRDTRSFTPRDRAVTEAVRPHLAAAYRHTRARERAGALVAALTEGVERAGGAVILLDRRRRLDHAGPAARHLLSAYCTRAHAETLERWLDRDPSAVPLEIPGEHGRLTVTYFREGDTGVLLLEEHRTGPDPERLRALGLTRREAEVLVLVAAGRDNEQIATALVVSAATVRKHLERIYGKLGVHSRTEAAARAHASSAPSDGVA